MILDMLNLNHPIMSEPHDAILTVMNGELLHGHAPRQARGASAINPEVGIPVKK